MFLQYFTANIPMVFAEVNPLDLSTFTSQLAGIGMPIKEWSLAEANGIKPTPHPLLGVMEAVRECKVSTAFIVRDLQGLCNQHSISVIISTYHYLQATKSPARVIFLIWQWDIPAQLQFIPVIEQELPNEEARRTILTALPARDREACVSASAGLSINEIAQALRLAKAQGRPYAQGLQQAKLTRLKASHLIVLPPSSQEIGGYTNMRAWLQRRMHSRIVPKPKGIMLVGLAGTGKSAIACQLGTSLKRPVIKLDLGAILDSLVGSSEKNLAHALKLVELCAPCILLIDEIDKGISTDSRGDGGVSRRLLGQLLTWLQERTADVLTVCTANDISGLPPEFSRKGRFDEIFYVGLPNQAEREAILQIHLNRLQMQTPNLSAIASELDGYVGAEIASICDEVAVHCEANGTYPLATFTDFMPIIRSTPALSHRYPDTIQKLNDWASTSAKSV